MENKNQNEEISIAASQSVKEQQYWTQKLAGTTEKTAFPYDIIEEPQHHGEECMLRNLDFTFPSGASAQLLKISAGSNPRLHMILSTVVTALLFRYSSSDDIILGTSIDRQEKEGDFINTVLALRNQLSPNMTLKELLLQMRQTVREAMEHRNYPIQSLLYDLNIPYDKGEFPLFDIAVLLDNIHSKAYLEQLNLNMTITFSSDGQTISGEVEYNSVRYTQDSMSRLVNGLTLVMENLVQNLDIPIEEIEILKDDEKKQLLETFNNNNTYSDYPKHKLLHQLFEDQVEITPANTAIIYDGESLTYEQLNCKANSLARVLRDNGIDTDIPVGLMVDISLEMVIGMLAILKAGGAFLPIEPDYPVERIQYVVENSQALVVLTQTAYMDMFSFEGRMLDIQQEELYSGDTSNLEAVAEPAHLAYIIYTSGSTGKPKGVMMPHQGIVNQIAGFKKMFYTGTALMNHIMMAPFTFDPSVQHVFSPLTYGAPLYLVDKTLKEDPQQLMEFILANKIDIFDAVPSQIDVLLETIDNLSGVSFKTIILAGEVFSKNLHLKIRKQLAVENLINIYGPTEAAINTTMYKCPDVENHATVPIGKPLMNYRVYILDENRKLKPIGVPGELYIGGDGVARGYINNESQNNEKFMDNPWRPGERIYKTGDIARWLPDGNLEFVGRMDHQVKIRGQRIELEEIDMYLTSYPDVKEAVVLAREDKNKIKYLSAYMVPNGKVEISEIRNFLISRLPSYMIPGHFVLLEAMPMTRNGKIDRKALAKIQSGQLLSGEYVAPRTPLEEKLAELWASELEMEKIGIADDYFNIGGDSIKSIRLINLINEQLSTDLKIVDLYASNTIEELAQLITERREEAEKGENADQPDDQYDEARKRIEAIKAKVMNAKNE